MGDLAFMRGPGSEFAEALKVGAAFTAAPKAPQGDALKAVCLDRFAGRQYVVATDSYRMVVVHLEGHKTLGSDFPTRHVLIPAQQARHMATGLRRCLEPVDWRLDGGQLRGIDTEQGEWDYVYRSDYEFPDWANLLTRDAEKGESAPRWRLAYDESELRHIIRQVTEGRGKDLGGKPIKEPVGWMMRMEATPDKVTFHWKNLQTDEWSQRELHSAMWLGAPGTVTSAINPRFLLGALEHSELVEIPPDGDQGPWRFPNGKVTVLVMPVRLPPVASERVEGDEAKGTKRKAQ